MNIAETLCARAVELGSQQALIDVRAGRERIYSFQDFDQASTGVAAQLQASGLQPGDGVLILHPVAIELYLVLVALFRVGCVAVFLDPSAGRAHIKRCCDIFPPKAFFGSRRAQLWRLAIPALRRIPISLSSGWFPGAVRIDISAASQQQLPIAAVKCDDPALVTFTSGSTGEPKAVQRTHGFLLAQHRVLEQTLDLRAGGRDLTTLPIFVLANLGSGVTSVLPDADLRSPGNIDPAPVLAQIARQRVETTAASPAFISRLLIACGRTGQSLSALKRVALGGAPVFPGVLRETKSVCPNADVMAVYGSTEAEPMAEISLRDIADQDFVRMRTGKGLLAGKPVPSISLRVIRDQWGQPISPLKSEDLRSLSLPAGEPGEIVVHGAHVLPGYLNGQGDAETKFEVDGERWHRTGDLGYFDVDGRLWLLGRCSAKIQDDRGTLYPFAVECAAMEISGIRRAALALLKGRRVLAVEAGHEVSTSDLQAQLNWAQLDQVIRVQRLPMDKRHNAKIDYVRLRKELMAATDLR